MIEFRSITDMHKEIAEVAVFEPEIAGSLNRMLRNSTSSDEYVEAGEFIKTYHMLALYGSHEEEIDV